MRCFFAPFLLVGCVIPAPLVPAGGSGSPVIRQGNQPSNFGFYTQTPVNGLFSFEVTVFDQNIDDPIFAQLYSLNGSSFFPLGGQAQLPGNRDDPTVRRGDLAGQHAWCCLFTSGGPSCPQYTDHLVYVVVATVPIPIDTDPPQSFPSFPSDVNYDFKYWAITCQ